MIGAPEARTPGASPGNADGSTEDRANVAPAADDRKAFHNLQALLALNAHAVYELAAGGYLVVSTRAAGACRECPDLRALAAFGRQIRGERG